MTERSLHLAKRAAGRVRRRRQRFERSAGRQRSGVPSRQFAATWTTRHRCRWGRRCRRRRRSLQPLASATGPAVSCRRLRRCGRRHARRCRRHRRRRRRQRRHLRRSSCSSGHFLFRALSVLLPAFGRGNVATACIGSVCGRRPAGSEACRAGSGQSGGGGRAAGACGGGCRCGSRREGGLAGFTLHCTIACGFVLQAACRNRGSAIRPGPLR